jgi:hypothetical protein
MTEKNTDLVRFGNSDVSFKQLQDIYSTVTGKTEKITKRITTPFRLKFEDLLNLHEQISQCSKQFSIRLSSCSVAVFHINGNKEIFSSIDRFKLYNRGNNVAVENVEITYTFLITLPELEKPQPYTLKIFLNSRIGLVEKSKEDTAMPDILSAFISGFSGQFSIEYVDYTVARTYLALFNEWVDALEKSQHSKKLSSIQKKSHHLRPVFSGLTLLAFLISLYLILGQHDGERLEQIDIFEFITVLGIGILLFRWSGYVLGRTAESAIDRVQPISYILLNRGDENLLAAQSGSNLRKSFQAIVATGATFLLSYGVTKYLDRVFQGIFGS